MSTKHLMSTTRFYRIWVGMNRRCKETKNPRYKDYGGRGIKQLWKSFEEFKNDMYGSYLQHEQEHGTHNTTIDRINNNGNYHKDNCKWSTRREQFNNTRIKKTQHQFIAYNIKTGECGIYVNQRQFAERRGLTHTRVSDILKGKLLCHKGWRFVPNTRENRRFLNKINHYGTKE